MEAAKKSIMRVLEKGSGTLINRCFAMYKLIEESSDCHAELLKYAFEIFGFVESDNSDPAIMEISKSEQDQLKNDYGDMVDGIIKSLIKRSYNNETEFYQELWNTFSTPIFKDEKAKVFAFYYSMIDKRLPFFLVTTGTRMTNKDFRERQRVLSHKIAKAKFILNNGNLFDQKTEAASHLLEIVESEEDPLDRLVLFTYIIEDIKDSKEIPEGISQALAGLIP